MDWQDFTSGLYGLGHALVSGCSEEAQFHSEGELWKEVKKERWEGETGTITARLQREEQVGAAARSCTYSGRPGRLGRDDDYRYSIKVRTRMKNQNKNENNAGPEAKCAFIKDFFRFNNSLVGVVHTKSIRLY